MNYFTNPESYPELPVDIKWLQEGNRLHYETEDAAVDIELTGFSMVNDSSIIQTPHPVVDFRYTREDWHVTFEGILHGTIESSGLQPRVPVKPYVIPYFLVEPLGFDPKKPLVVFHEDGNRYFQYETSFKSGPVAHVVASGAPDTPCNLVEDKILKETDVPADTEISVLFETSKGKVGAIEQIYGQHLVTLRDPCQKLSFAEQALAVRNAPDTALIAVGENGHIADIDGHPFLDSDEIVTSIYHNHVNPITMNGNGINERSTSK